MCVTKVLCVERLFNGYLYYTYQLGRHGMCLYVTQRGGGWRVEGDPLDVYL